MRGQSPARLYLHSCQDNIIINRIERRPGTMSEQYSIREANTRQELDDIMDVIWTANYSPYEPFMQIVFPILGFTSAHRDAARAESKKRFWNQHQSDPSSHWFCAFDTVTKNVVGCAQWVVAESNVFASGIPKLAAPWWPEGDSRSFCESVLNQVYRPRASWMTRPHCCKCQNEPGIASGLPFALG